MSCWGSFLTSKGSALNQRTLWKSEMTARKTPVLQIFWCEYSSKKLPVHMYDMFFYYFPLSLFQTFEMNLSANDCKAIYYIGWLCCNVALIDLRISSLNVLQSLDIHTVWTVNFDKNVVLWTENIPYSRNYCLYVYDRKIILLKSVHF